MTSDGRTRAPARRVLIAITDTERGGTPIQMATLARSVRARGCEVMLVSALEPGPVLREVQAAGVRTATLGVHSKQAAWLALPRLRSLIRGFRPDVVQTQLFHANLVGRLAAIGTGVPVINGHVSVDDDRPRWRTAVDRMTNRLAATHCAVSQAVADRVCARDLVPADRMTVIHAGAEPARPPERSRAELRREFGIPEDARVAGWTGRLDPVKDLRTLVFAVGELPDWWLVLAGEGPERANVERWAREAGIQDRIRLTGELADVSPVLEVADVFALTSRWEGFGLSVLEAMTAGVPVVASAVGGVPEIVTHGHDGLLVPPGDSRPVARALVEADSRPDLGVNARATARGRFTETAQADAYMELWERVLVDRPVSPAAPARTRRRRLAGEEGLRVLVMAPYPMRTAPSQRFRFEQYVAPLAEAGIRLDISSFLNADAMRIVYTRGHLGGKTRAVIEGISRRRHDLEVASEYDLVFVHREAWPIGYAWIEHVLTRLQLPYVFDFDDSIYLPNFNPANRLVAPLKRGAKTADSVRRAALVVAGNEHLAAWARRHSPRVQVIPTTIDTAAYTPRPNGARERLCVGWSGSVTTIDHLDALSPLLRDLQRERDVALRVIGDPTFRIEGADVEALPWRESTELDDLREIDIGIMPLPDDEWGRGKCGLKALQYMALGIPTVMSPVGVNRRIARDDAALLASNPAEWAAALRALLDQPDLRARLSAAGRRRVEEEYSIQATAPAYVEALRAAAGIAP